MLMISGKYNSTSEYSKLSTLNQDERDIHSTTSECSNFTSNFNHSFRFSSSQNLHHLQKQENAEEYLKRIISKNISNRDLKLFYNRGILSKGILNSYLRVLEIYHEYIIADEEDKGEDQMYFRIKFFETEFYEEYLEEKKTGVISGAIDDEFFDLFDYKCLIIPISVGERVRL